MSSKVSNPCIYACVHSFATKCTTELRVLSHLCFARSLAPLWQFTGLLVPRVLLLKPMVLPWFFPWDPAGPTCACLARSHLLLAARLPQLCPAVLPLRHLTPAPPAQTCPAEAPAWQDMVPLMTKNRSCIKEQWDPNKVWSRKYNDPPKIWFCCSHRSPLSASKRVNYLYFAFKLSFGYRFPS